MSPSLAFPQSSTTLARGFEIDFAIMKAMPRPTITAAAARAIMSMIESPIASKLSFVKSVILVSPA